MVNCEYCVGLRSYRVCPSIFTNTPRHYRSMAMPGKPGSLGDNMVALLKESPPCASVGEVHCNVKKYGHVPCEWNSSQG